MTEPGSAGCGSEGAGPPIGARYPRPPSKRAGNGNALASETMSEEAYGTDWIRSTTIQAKRSGPRVCQVVEWETPQAESHRPSIMRISSRAAPRACNTCCEAAFLGVRKNG